MVTIKDVAHKAQVSISTVSHVINGTRYVSEELAGRVRTTMLELDYHPNILARGLRRGDTKTIGLVVPDNSNPYFAEFARVIEDAGFANGYSVVLCNTDGSIEKEAAYIRTLVDKNVDGIVFIASGSKQEHFGELKKNGIPAVVADRDIGGSGVDTVVADNQLGGAIAVKHIASLGHRKIACITGPSEVTSSQDRVLGYRRALVEANIRTREDYIVEGDFRFAGGSVAAARLLALDESPSAVFVCNDMMAIGALQAFRTARVRVPEDISVVGYDDIPLACAVTPALTTIAQPIVEMATLSIEMLMTRMLGSGERTNARRRVLEPRIVVRESCREFGEGREQNHD